MEKRAFTVIELSVVMAIFLIMITILMPFVNIARARARRIECSKNLMRVSLGLNEYARAHKDAFPAKLADLYPKYVADERVFDCPSSKAAGTGLNPDYSYTAGLGAASPGKDILAQDFDGNHKDGHRNILRVNGSVEWI